jgi:hemerythrin-like domain-containing protein
MAVQIGAKPDSGFDDPIGMLTDCHRRIELFLGILCTVVERASDRGLTGEEAAAVQAALQYFRSGGTRHTADEEESLFPRLRSETNAAAFAELDKLEADHHVAADLHAAIEALYSAWIARGAADVDAEQKLSAATAQLRALYRAHIEIEESQVFPRAAQVLDRATIASIGREFRARRA